MKLFIILILGLFGFSSAQNQISGGGNFVDSSQIYHETLNKALYVIKKMGAAQDSMYKRAGLKLHDLDVALKVTQTKLAGLIIFNVLFVLIVTFLLWRKAVKIKKHYEGLLEYQASAIPHIERIQAYVMDLDKDYPADKMVPHGAVPWKSIWPKWWRFFLFGIAGLWLVLLTWLAL